MVELPIINYVVVRLVAPVIKKDPHSQKVSEGSSVWLHCEYAGTPYPFTRVVWIKDEIPLPTNTSRVYIHASNGTLHLRQVELNDAGNYYCVVNTTSYEPLKSRFAALNVERKLNGVLFAAMLVCSLG